MSTPEELEWDADYERAIEAATGWMTAQVDLECCNPLCGLPIHVGAPIVFDGTGYCHPLCDVEHALDVALDRREHTERDES